MKEKKSELRKFIDTIDEECPIVKKDEVFMKNA